MAMDFGIFYEIELKKPYGPRAEYDVFQQVIAQVVEAERVGFSNFWSVEHHFLSEFAYSSAPEVLYGALSQRTSKIRIGHGVRLLPFPYNHPIRVAEMGATVDSFVRRADGVRHRTFGEPRRARGLRHQSQRDARAMGRGARRRGGRVDQRGVLVGGQVFQDSAARDPAQAAAEAASAVVVCLDRPRNPRHRGTQGARSAVIHSAGRSRGAETPNRDLSRGYRAGQAGWQVRQRPCCDLHDGALRGDQQGGARERQGGVRVVRAQGVRSGRVGRYLAIG